MPPKRESDDGEMLPDLFGEARWRLLVVQTGLTRRQAQVARLICHGCADKQIALRLGIVLDSVRLHVKKLFARFDVRSRMGLLVHLVLIDETRTKASKRGRARGTPRRKRGGPTSSGS
ncbi:MAG: hypothetical protein GDA67_15425 [Nitrospira sp. CR1.3]|nr:hypothetical protein [Nitrospira sp. CR1.3]